MRGKTIMKIYLITSIALIMFALVIVLPWKQIIGIDMVKLIKENKIEAILNVLFVIVVFAILIIS
jgi:hypothetical protein